MPTNLEDGFRLAQWRVRPHAGQLTRGILRKTERRVEPRAMQVLLALAARPGAFVSKGELFANVWNGRPVTDDCLSGAIHTLRRALNDDPRDPAFIETRNNVGYRLIADVRPGRPRRVAIMLAAALAMATIGVLLVTTDPSSESDRNQPLAIAVLPFDNQSGAAAGEHFAAAMTDAVMSDLARSRRARVISRTSVARAVGEYHSARELADALGADVLVEGAVLTSGGQVRIAAQLIDPQTDALLWTQQYHRTPANVFELQREISGEIAAQIGIVTGVVERPAASLPEPYQAHFLQARYLLAQETVASTEEALQGFARLTEAHPDFAHAFLGTAQSLLYLYKAGARDRDDLRAAQAAIRRFENLAGPSAASHRCMGQLHLFLDWDFAAAENRYRNALLHNASDIVARHRYAWLLVAQQRFDEARELIEQIRLLDPMYYARPGLATLLLFASDVDGAIAEFERLDAISPLDKTVLRIMATAYLAAGRELDAQQTLVRMLHAGAAATDAQVPMLAALERDDLYRHILSNNPFRSTIVSAGFHLLLGDADAALSDLETAIERHDPYVIYLAALPELAPLHAHPRFQAILADIGLGKNNQRLTDRPKLSSAYRN